MSSWPHFCTQKWSDAMQTLPSNAIRCSSFAFCREGVRSPSHSVSFSLVHSVGKMPFNIHQHCQNHAMCVALPVCHTRLVPLEPEFCHFSIQPSLSLEKLTIHSWAPLQNRHLKGLKSAWCDYPAAHQILAGLVSQAHHGQRCLLTCSHLLNSGCKAYFMPKIMEPLLFPEEN